MMAETVYFGFVIGNIMLMTAFRISVFPRFSFSEWPLPFPFVPEPSWNIICAGGTAQPRFRAMPATAATLVHRQERMRICLLARSTR
jgi:hypothetical protein